jgi:photosystem II stability/assembly factor-like uncharacterized protein
MTRGAWAGARLLMLAIWGCGGMSAGPFGGDNPDSATAGRGGSAGSGGGGSGGSATGGSATGGAAGRDGGTPAPIDAPPVTGPLPADPCVAAGSCPPGVWVNVTPSGMNPADLRPAKDSFGPGSIVGDPARPSDLYVGGSKSGLWKSTDYGNTWTRINTQIPDVPRGLVIAVAGTTPATVWSVGYNNIFKSVDGGVTFKETKLTVSLYSLQVDPNDFNHLISGLHEADGVYESIDGGASWQKVTGPGFPSGGVSWYPFFIKSTPEVTRRTWFAIAQGGATPALTSDRGATWTTPAGLRGLQHPHGNAQIHQAGSTLFVGGLAGPGQGIYRSTDLGVNWSRVDGQMPQAMIWGTAKNVYAMYAWACSNCNLGTNFLTAPLPGDTWSKGTAPPALVIGPNSLVVTNDGNHNVFVGLMWDQGLWRYVEP